MKRAVLFILLSSFALVVFAGQPQAPKGWEFLSRTDIGAQAFTDAHPQWDGRGVLIAVCDSGVELGTPGLLTTSEGKPKILDARVFCNEGKIDLEKAERGKDEHGEAVHGPTKDGEPGKWLYGLDKAPSKPDSGQDIYVGYFKESDFKNSDAKEGDLNNNGRTDDVYGLVVFKSGDKWVALLDTNGDGSLADEQALSDFSQSRQSFHLRGRDLHEQANLMTFALNLWMDKDDKEAALYMADGSHGTHVSGICAGYDIDGQKGFDGIAPGAQILALKIGSNILSGGATTPGSMVSAWRYAVKRAKELNMPLVIQMSYGVGSEQEGKAVAEKLLDEVLDENPGAVAAVSAGNEGPGFSTVGLPACGKNILAVGAVLNKTSAKDLYGANLTQDELFAFSDRGGEMAKPEVVAPGFAASTVPVYSEGRNVMRGTSMASPQVSGALALVYSAALANQIPIRGDVARGAIMRGAVPLPGYGPADQGYGLANVSRAWAAYQALSARKSSQPVQYTVETESPEMADRKGPAIFWRGDFFPEGSRSQDIAVAPVFPKDASEDFKANFFQAFDVTADAGWLTVERGLGVHQGRRARAHPRPVQRQGPLQAGRLPGHHQGLRQRPVGRPRHRGPRVDLPRPRHRSRTIRVLAPVQGRARHFGHQTRQGGAPFFPRGRAHGQREPGPQAGLGGKERPRGLPLRPPGTQHPRLGPSTRPRPLHHDPRPRGPGARRVGDGPLRELPERLSGGPQSGPAGPAAGPLHA